MYFRVTCLSVVASLSLLPYVAAQTFTDEKDKASYAVGVKIGESLAIGRDLLNTEVVIQGLLDSLEKNEYVMKPEDLNAAFMKWQQDARAAQMAEMEAKAKEMAAEGEAFLAENKAREGVVTLPSGLQYEVLKEGTGKSPGPTSTVKSHYAGTLIDGTPFDSSYDRNEPFVTPVNRVIPGWTEALQLMKEGAKWKLYIPHHLAYGERGSPPAIPPFSTLIFEMELIEVQE